MNVLAIGFKTVSVVQILLFYRNANKRSESATQNADLSVDPLYVATYIYRMMETHSNSEGLAAELGKRQPFASLHQEAYLNLVRTHEQLAGQFSRLFKKHGLSDPQYNALRILRGEKNPMQVYQIADRMVSEQTDISRLVERLVTAGWVKRERCGEDRRVVWVALTTAGRSLLKKLDRPVKELHDSQFTRLNDRELATLNRLLFRARNPNE